jgi:hypothetical protein
MSAKKKNGIEKRKLLEELKNLETVISRIVIKK